MMTDALIGYTGFVGGALLQAGSFGALFNSSNIADIRGQEFDRVVCAGIYARKWWANQNPDEDAALIQGLLDHLAEVRCRRFVLISTVDVYGLPWKVTEADEPDPADMHPYGRHRRIAEKFISERFVDHRIIRLPGLFGFGLKKNIIFDLINDNQLDKINPAAAFQYYPTWRLPGDLEVIEANGPSVLNIVSEPVATEAIWQRFFRNKKIGPAIEPAPRYDVGTLYPALLGSGGRYHLTQDQVMDDLAIYIAKERKGIA